MNSTTRALVQALLILPAVLFMTAVVVQNLPVQNEPAHTAHRIVMWYATRHWTLWVLLIALPMAVLVIGGITLARYRNYSMHLPPAARQTLPAIQARRPMRFVAATTLTAGVILAIVAIHILAN